MKAREARHHTVLKDAQKVDASDKFVVMPGEKQIGDVSQQDLQQASRIEESEARPKIMTRPSAGAICRMAPTTLLTSDGLINRSVSGRREARRV
jgi:hypothetical protein